MKKGLMTVLVIVMICALVLSACATSTTQTTTSEQPASETAAEAATETESAAAAEDTSAGGGFKIGILNPYLGNTWRAQMLDEVEKTCEQLKADGTLASYEVASVSDDATEQLNQFNQMISKGVDAIVVGAVSATAIEPAVKKAQDAGILVVVEDNGAACEGTYFVGNSHEAYAGIPMQWICDKMTAANKTNLVILQGLAGNETEVERGAAMDRVLANYPDIKVVATAPQSWSMTEAQSVMSTLLSTYDNIDAVYGPEGQEGVLRAYENAGVELPIMNADYTYSFLQYWKDNNMDSITVPSDPSICATAVKFTVKLLQGEEIDEAKLLPNPLDESLVNWICLDPPYCVVTAEADKNAEYLKAYEGMQVLTLDEALALCEGQPSTYLLSMPASDDYINSFFK
ncbi:MAG: substrate-binding domain-containing protein [Christensenella sp.]|nr:substrate-binding domain-containing protein [Christensenella sp.]